MKRWIQIIVSVMEGITILFALLASFFAMVIAIWEIRQKRKHYVEIPRSVWYMDKK